MNRIIMKTKLLLTFCLLAISPMLFAQSDGAMNLKQCIDYALVHSSTIANAKLDEYIAYAKIGETRAIGLPQINISADAIDNPTLKKLFFKGDNNFLQGTPAFTGNGNDVAAVDNFFQLRSSGDANITASQIIFNGSYIVGLQTSKTFAELSKKSSQKAAIDVIESIKKAYYMVLINKERLISIASNISRLDSILLQTERLNKNGFVEKLDVNRLEVRKLNLISEKQKFENISNLSLALLKFQMGYPAKDPININENIEQLKSTISNTPIENTTIEYGQRIEYSLLETKKKLDLQKLRYVNSGYLPSLAAFGTLGYTRSDVKFGNLFKKEWFDYSMVGLSFKLPIFDGLSKYYQAQQAKLELKKTENTMQNFKELIDFQTTQSSITYNNAIKTLETQTQNIALAKEIARITKIKYQEGVGSNIEFINAEADLKDAQTNYYDAIYQVLVALVEHQKSIGKLSAE